MHGITGPSGSSPPESCDVVVIGAGHNALVCAAYLAEAGLHVVVLESSDAPGGNTRSEPLTLPGFVHDPCASAHVLIQSNPLLRDDELGLCSTYGLEYLRTDPAVVLPQHSDDHRDGSLVMRPDLGGTADAIARWSPNDAQNFTDMIAEWDGRLAAVHGRWNSGLDLGSGEAAEHYQALRVRSAWDVVHERFTHPAVRSFMLWLAMGTIQDPRRRGTGVLPASFAAGRLRFGWSTPVGGSQALPDALIRLLDAHGATLVCGARVDGVDVEHGRAAAVRTSEGARIRARRAVVSSAHLTELPGLLSGIDIPADIEQARQQWRPGLSVFAVHAALRGDLSFATADGPVHSVAAGFGTTDGIAAQLDAHRRGETDAGDPWLLAVNQTVVDPGRAPDGAATLKLLTIAPYRLASGQDWAEAKDSYAAALIERVAERCDGFGDDDIMALRAESPVDVAAVNGHNIGGSCHGGQFLTDAGVIGGWPSHRASIPGLFLTGATTHPGGSVSGRPGRNAARTVLTDLGLDPATVMGES